MVSGITIGVVAKAGSDRPNEDRFNHPKHAKLFPFCTTCHQGVLDSAAPLFPVLSDCVSCHDGTIQPRIEFVPRTGMRPSNLRFAHQVHAREALRKTPSDSTIETRCQACHAERQAPRMEVKHTVVGNCLECHQLSGSHLAVPDTACATCHVPLWEAPRLSRSDVARFSEPESHRQAGFELAGHGQLAKPASGGRGVAAGCATCHAREFCITCHVNAPEVPAIQALGLDERSTALKSELPVPPSHREAGFLESHGRAAAGKNATCAACHTQQSCTECHAGVAPRSVALLRVAGAGRGQGATVTRKSPPNHTWEFRERHGPEANARASSCEGCHVRSQCLECHRPDPAGTPTRQAYHPQGFLTRHPASAYSRDANCTDCHNPGQFCQTCHAQSGLIAKQNRIGSRGYHDAYPNFGLGHGQAARQSLESCASCHAERDCTSCHSAVAGGFRFSPHGPGFNPERMLKKNASVCVACHGRNIPGVP
jgi:hypothetical protein